MAGTEDPVLLDKEVEGEFESTPDLLFFRIGASVPLKSSGSEYDPEDPPKHPLAASERFGLTFVAHSEGFFVTRTSDLIKLAKEIKEITDLEREKKVAKGQKRPTVEEISLLDVKIGKPSILALSVDSLVLAATVGGEIHLFSVPSLGRRSQNPLVSCSTDKSGSIRDFRWCKNEQKYFVALLTYGALFLGNMKGQLKKVEEKVDAVDWSTEKNLVAVAHNRTLRILSEKFETKMVMNLSFQSKGLDADSRCQMKVDSIKWTTCNTIIIGCKQHGENGSENDYLVQLVTTEKKGFEPQSKPLVVSFMQLFSDMGDQVSGGGPHLLTKYLERWRLAVLANRRNRDNHIVLVELNDDESKKAIALELEEENYTPRIELQENGDENVILDFDVDKISLYEKLSLVREEGVLELTPYCILLCITIEGKIVLFHIARTTDLSTSLPVPLEIDFSNIQEDNSSPPLSTLEECPLVVSNLKNEQTPLTVHLKQVEQIPSAVEQKKITDSFAIGNGSSSGQPSISISKLHTALPSMEGLVPSARDSTKPSAQNIQVDFPRSIISTSSSLSSSMNDTFSTKKTSGSEFLELGGTTRGLTESSSIPGIFSGSMLSGKPLVSEVSSINFSSLTSSTSLSMASDAKEHNGAKVQYPASGSFASFARNDAVGFKTFTSTLEEKSASAKLFSSSRPSLTDNQTQKTSQSVNSLELSRHLCNVNDMVRELDRLLLAIEAEGGFADNCILDLKNLVFAIETGFEGLSQRLRTCKGMITDLVAKVQLLQDKMVKVSAKEVYMEGVVRQASNSQYWDVWSRQKLGPEFELKRQQILKLNQGLRNQLIELERHFNHLELNKFGECRNTSKGWRTINTSKSSRRIQKVHSLHNTVVSQLSVAEHLFLCLEEQMTALKISSPPVKQQGIARDLLESIGLSCHAESFQSPDIKRGRSSVSSMKHPLSMSYNTFKEHAKQNKSNVFKGPEQETGRRRRDSLDRNLTSFKPQKTTVKRLMQQECSKVADDSTVTGGSFNNVAMGGTGSQKKSRGSATASSQSLMYKFEMKADQSGRDPGEKNSRQDSGAPTGFISKWEEEFPQSTQSALEIKSWRATDLQVLHSSNVSPSVSESSKRIGGIYKKEDISSMTGNLRSGPVQTNMNFSSVSNSPVCVPSSNANKTLTNETSQKFVSSMMPPNFQSLETGGKFQAGMLGNIGGHAAMSSSSTTKNNLKQDTGVAFGPGIFSSLSAGDKGSAPEVTTLVGKSPSLNASTPSKAPTTFAPSSPSSSTLSSPFSKAMITQTQSSTVIPEKQSHVNKQSTVAKEQSTSVLPSLFLTTSSPISSSSLHVPSQSSITTASAHNAVLHTAITTSPAPISPLDPITSQQLDFKGSTTRQFSTASSSSPFVALTTTASSSPIDSSSASLVLSSTVKEKENNLNNDDDQEDEMEEESPDGPSTLNLGGIGGFGFGSTPVASTPKVNPFGGSFGPANPTSSPFSATTSPGQLFRPASFSIPTIQASQPMNSTTVSGGFSGFGQSAQVGSGQQALGSVLGAFGQSRQFGLGQGFSFASSGFGGTSASASTGSSFSPAGGFAGAATGGFAAVSSVGGFASAATGGGFGAVASAGIGFAGPGSGGGFAALESSVGAFASTPAGAGFASAATGGGFTSFGSGAGGFAGVGSGGGFVAGASGGSGFGIGSGGFGSGSGANKPPAELLMKMRK